MRAKPARHALIIPLLLLLPTCGLVGYGVAYAIAPLWDVDRLDRKLFASVYGLLFIGVASYIVVASLLITIAVRSGRSSGRSDR